MYVDAPRFRSRRVNTIHPSNYCWSCERTPSGRIWRSSSERRAFKQSHPCPSTRLATGACPGWVIDHIKPLACGGPGTQDNMQWQSQAEARETGCAGTGVRWAVILAARTGVLKGGPARFTNGLAPVLADASWIVTVAAHHGDIATVFLSAVSRKPGLYGPRTKVLLMLFQLPLLCFMQLSRSNVLFPPTQCGHFQGSGF